MGATRGPSRSENLQGFLDRLNFKLDVIASPPQSPRRSPTKPSGKNCQKPRHTPLGVTSSADSLFNFDETSTCKSLCKEDETSSTVILGAPNTPSKVHNATRKSMAMDVVSLPESTQTTSIGDSMTPNNLENRRTPDTEISETMIDLIFQDSHPLKSGRKIAEIVEQDQKETKHPKAERKYFMCNASERTDVKLSNGHGTDAKLSNGQGSDHFLAAQKDNNILSSNNLDVTEQNNPSFIVQQVKPKILSRRQELLLQYEQATANLTKFRHAKDEADRQLDAARLRVQQVIQIEKAEELLIEKLRKELDTIDKTEPTCLSSEFLSKECLVETDKAPEVVEEKMNRNDVKIETSPSKNVASSKRDSVRHAAQTRTVKLKNLAVYSNVAVVQSLVWGGPLEFITFIAEGLALVKFMFAEHCQNYFTHAARGISMPEESRMVTVELGTEPDPVDDTLKNFREDGVTRCVRVTGVDKDWGEEGLVEIAEGDATEKRQVERIIDGVNGKEVRTVEFRFSSVHEAVAFKHSIRLEDKFEHCIIKHVIDPCHKATGIHLGI